MLEDYRPQLEGLKYSGVIINDPTIIQAATQEAMKVEQNEKS